MNKFSGMIIRACILVSVIAGVTLSGGSATWAQQQAESKSSQVIVYQMLTSPTLDKGGETGLAAGVYPGVEEGFGAGVYTTVGFTGAGTGGLGGLAEGIYPGIEEGFGAGAYPDKLAVVL